MRIHLLVLPAVVLLITGPGRGQTTAPAENSVPIYRVTVIERTVKAVNYQYRNGPTRIDFRGTVLLPQSHGDATVESKKGRTEIDAHLEGLQPPTRFGTEYLTYVLWAITPQGHAKNIGEVLADSSNKCKLRVTTDLQTFGMIITAEPYGAVRQPSDVVVMENEIRPDTSGKVDQIQAKYDLMPRGGYTYNKPVSLAGPAPDRGKVSMDEYQQLLEVYEAQNAVQLARSAGADRYAPDTFVKAEQMLRDAQAMQARKAGLTTTVTTARAAAQTAEDARMIAVKRAGDERLAIAHDEAKLAQQRVAAARAEANRAVEDAAEARAKIDEERAARQRAEMEAAVARERLAQSQGQPAPSARPAGTAQPGTAAMRTQLMRQLGALDSPRGLVVTLPNAYFAGIQPRAAAYERLANMAAVIKNQPGLVVEVEGHTDSSGDDAQDRVLSESRAQAVRDALVRNGVPAGAVVARGFGKSRPLVSNATTRGREQNRRVEIVISGNPIGETPAWARSYSVRP